jgi:hypothetical protein
LLDELVEPAEQLHQRIAGAIEPTPTAPKSRPIDFSSTSTASYSLATRMKVSNSPSPTFCMDVERREQRAAIWSPIDEKIAFS